MNAYHIQQRHSLIVIVTSYVKPHSLHKSSSSLFHKFFPYPSLSIARSTRSVKVETSPHTADHPPYINLPSPRHHGHDYGSTQSSSRRYQLRPHVLCQFSTIHKPMVLEPIGTSCSSALSQLNGYQQCWLRRAQATTKRSLNHFLNAILVRTCKRTINASDQWLLILYDIQPAGYVARPSQARISSIYL